MILDAGKLDMGIAMLTESLRHDILVVTFTKKDGTERVMRCTKKLELIPTEFHPKPASTFSTDMQIEQAKPIHQRDPQVITAFDLEKNAWRSFRYTTIKTLMVAD